MQGRKGFRTVCQVLLVLASSSLYANPPPDLKAEELAAMMTWWENYGRYWEEADPDASGSVEEQSYAWLDGWLPPPGRRIASE